jgi:hypothetical protein
MASYRKESCFFKTMLLLTKRPLRTRNKHIFTLKFWNIPLRTTTSFLTSRNTSREESFWALRRSHHLRTGGVQHNQKKSEQRNHKCVEVGGNM